MERLAVRRFEPSEPQARVRDLALAGLRSRPKRLPPSLFYDDVGSELFERITALPEYYLTRTEASLLRRYAREICDGGADPLVELGSGSSEKTRILLDACVDGDRPLHYVPVDISEGILLPSSRALLDAYPTLRVTAVVAEYGDAIRRLDLARSALILFLGSSIGNFEPAAAASLLASLRPADTPLLVGFDRVKDPAELHAAYNDSEGVTARFNLNVLARLNREAEAGFDLSLFSHRALWNATESRIEMHLVSEIPQTVPVAGVPIPFDRGETIHTENSYKFSPTVIESVSRRGGFRVGRTWSDEREWFTLARLTPA